MSNYEVLKSFLAGAKSGSSENIFIDGDTVYSYGVHFPLAKRVEDEFDEFIVNISKYSRTTSKHQSELRGLLFRYNDTAITYLTTEEMKLN